MASSCGPPVAPCSGLSVRRMEVASPVLPFLSSFLPPAEVLSDLTATSVAYDTAAPYKLAITVRLHPDLSKNGFVIVEV